MPGMEGRISRPQSLLNEASTRLYTDLVFPHEGLNRRSSGVTPRSRLSLLWLIRNDLVELQIT